MLLVALAGLVIAISWSFAPRESRRLVAAMALGVYFIVAITTVFVVPLLPLAGLSTNLLCQQSLARVEPPDPENLAASPRSTAIIGHCERGARITRGSTQALTGSDAHLNGCLPPGTALDRSGGATPSKPRRACAGRSRERVRTTWGRGTRGLDTTQVA